MFRTYRWTALCICLTFALLAQQGMIYFMAPILPFFLVRSFFAQRKNKNDTAGLRIASTKFYAWALMFCLVTGLHFYYEYAKTEARGEVVRQVLEYRRQRGEFPDSLGEVNANVATLARRWHVNYLAVGNEPQLSVASTWIIDMRLRYDFKTGAWD